MENKLLRIEMPDGSKWDVPVMIIAKNRAKYYKDEFGGDVEKSLKEDTLPLFIDDYEIHDWAANNMNWDDVKAFAKKAPDEKREIDFQEGWVNGDYEIISGMKYTKKKQDYYNRLVDNKIKKIQEWKRGD